MSDQEVNQEHSTAIVAQGGGGALLRPVAGPKEVMAAHTELIELCEQTLQDGIDLFIIPGTKKRSLMKAGAERINAAFNAMPEYEVYEKEIDHDYEQVTTVKKPDWSGGYTMVDGKRKPNNDPTLVETIVKGFYRYVINCRLVNRSTGMVYAQGLGSCSTLEGKYKDRPHDCENTVLKMAQKRAYVAATLNAYGLSDRFTQDMEDGSISANTGKPRSGADESNDDYQPNTQAPANPGEVTMDMHKEAEAYMKMLKLTKDEFEDCKMALKARHAKDKDVQEDWRLALLEAKNVHKIELKGFLFEWITTGILPDMSQGKIDLAGEVEQRIAAGGTVGSDGAIEAEFTEEKPAEENPTTPKPPSENAADTTPIVNATSVEPSTTASVPNTNDPTAPKPDEYDPFADE